MSNWTPEAIAALVTALAGLVTAIGAAVHSVRTRQRMNGAAGEPGQPGGTPDHQP